MIKNKIEQALAALKNLNTTTKRLVMSVAAVSFISLVAIVWVLSHQLGMLFGHLTPSRMSQIMRYLDENQITYQVGQDGQSVYVAKDKVAVTRLKLMQDKSGFQNATGLELFEQSAFGETEFAQKVKLQRALQGELARTIMSLKPIINARVHLVIPEDKLFRSNQQGKAAITLELYPESSLSAKEIEGIQKLVAASSKSISSEDVTLLDSYGNVLNQSQADNKHEIQLGGKLDVEQRYQTKLEHLLKTVFQAKPFSTLVTVNLNHEESNVHKEELIPVKGQESGAVIHTNTTTNSANKVQADNVVFPESKNETKQSDYQYGREVTDSKSYAGSIQNINVSVIVPSDTDEQLIQQLQKTIETGLGLQKSRGDNLQISAVGPGATFQSDEIVNAPTQSLSSEIFTYLDIKRIEFKLTILTILLVLLLIVVSIRKSLESRRQLLMMMGSVNDQAAADPSQGNVCS